LLDGSGSKDTRRTHVGNLLQGTRPRPLGHIYIYVYEGRFL